MSRKYNYDIALIRKYLDGKLDARAMYELERQSQEDPLLMDLILGMEKGDQEQHKAALEEIDERIKKRTDNKTTRVLPLWIKITAAACTLVVFGLMIWISQKPKNQPIAKNNNSKSDSTITRVLPTEVSDTLLLSQSDKAPLIVKAKKSSHIKAYKVPEATLPEEQIEHAANLPDIHLQNLNEVTVHQNQQKELQDKLKADTIQTVLAGRVPGVQIAEAKSGFAKRRIIKSSELSETKNKDTHLGAFPDSNIKPTLLIAKQGPSVFNSDTQKFNKASALQASNQIMIRGLATIDTISEAHPQGGWQYFSKYLSVAAISPTGKKGAVSMQFKINPESKITSFKILKGVDDATNAKAQQIILSGPKWLANKNGKTEKIKLTIDFK